MLTMTYGKFKQKNFTDIHGSIIPATATEHMELHGLWYVGALLSSTSLSFLALKCLNFTKSAGVTQTSLNS